MWDFSTEPEFAAKLAWAERLVRDEVFPLETFDLSWPDLRRAIAPLQEKVKAEGLWAAHLSQELGGGGFGQLKLGLLHEILGMSPLGPIVFGNQPPDSGNAEILAQSGTDDQKREWLEPLLDGRMYSAFAMTEPDAAGSDPTQLRVTAVQEGDDWIINGRKWFISNASIADFVIVVAVTDPEAEPHRRVSQFIVPAGTAGMTVERMIPSLTDPAPDLDSYAAHSALRFERVQVPSTAMLGERGRGFEVAQVRLGPGRIHHCMRWIGMARRAFDMMCERATYRTVKDGVLGDKQTIRAWIADSAAEIHAARLMTLHAAWLADTQGFKAARREIGYIKYYGASVLHDVVDRSLQVHGSLGFSADMPLERMYRLARAARLYDGPDEVHRDTVARLILRQYDAPQDGIPSEHIPTRRAAASLNR